MDKLLEFKNKLINLCKPTDEIVIRVCPAELVVYFKDPLTLNEKVLMKQRAIGTLLLSLDDTPSIVLMLELNNYPMYILGVKSESDNLVYGTCSIISKSIGGISAYENVELKRIEVELSDISSQLYTLDL